MGMYDGSFPILSLITYVPLAGAILLLFVNRENTGTIKALATVVATRSS